MSVMSALKLKGKAKRISGIIKTKKEDLNLY